MLHSLRNIAVSLLIALPLVSQSVAAQDKLVADISEHVVSLNYSFTGSDLILFGAIDHDEKHMDPNAQFDVIINVVGPSLPVVVRKKEHVAGIWVNNASATFKDAPSFYIQASTRPIDDITDMKTLRDNSIGFEHQNYSATGLREGEKIKDYIGGFLRNKKAAGLYQLSDESMELVSDTLFRADLHIPTNVPVGDFEAEIHLFKNGQLIASQRSDLKVVKTGFSEVVFNFAHQSPALYGLMAIFIALASGWIAGAVVRD